MAMRQKHGRVSWIVLAVNAVMFFVGGPNDLRVATRSSWNLMFSPSCDSLPKTIQPSAAQKLILRDRTTVSSQHRTSR